MNNDQTNLSNDQHQTTMDSMHSNALGVMGRIPGRYTPTFRSRVWFLTTFETNEEHRAHLLDASFWDYAILGEENCPTTGRHHFHLYGQLKCTVTWSRMRSQ